MYHFTRLEDGQKRRTDRLAEALRFEDAARERWLFVSPHDDDVAIGGGMWVQAAVEAGIDVQAVIVTDGRMGYCTLDQRDRITEIRHAECIESFEVLGVRAENVKYIGYPDGGLFTLQGRRPGRQVARSDSDSDPSGYMGLQNAFTWRLRQFRPTRLFCPSPLDLHPDHRITYQELMISIFHAAGAIWPELGEPLDQIPTVYDMAVYCDFAQPPNLELRAEDPVFEKKLDAIGRFRSQLQIASMVESVRAAGAYEYLCEASFPLYTPEHYKKLFA